MMSLLRVRLFGAFEASVNKQPLHRLNGKARELFCYLLLDRGQSHSRERLAAALWDGVSALRSKKYLRQALWRLHAALSFPPKSSLKGLLRIASECVCLESSGLWLDVAVFEQAFAAASRGGELTEPVFERLPQAVRLYRGDLLQGYSQAWCLNERERLQSMYLTMLGQLMGRCEAHREYEAGLGYGNAVLRCDPADERAHQRMMRLRYLAGDRTGALRQYARCVKALKDELGVAPTVETSQLYHHIRAGSLASVSIASATSPARPAAPLARPDALVNLIERLRTMLSEAENELRNRERATARTSSRKLRFFSKAANA